MSGSLAASASSPVAARTTSKPSRRKPVHERDRNRVVVLDEQYIHVLIVAGAALGASAFSRILCQGLPSRGPIVAERGVDLLVTTDRRRITMTRTLSFDHTPKELVLRRSGTCEVALFWSRRTHRAAVKLEDDATGMTLELPLDPDRRPARRLRPSICLRGGPRARRRAGVRVALAAQGQRPAAYAARSAGCSIQCQLPPLFTACIVAVVTPSSDVTCTVTAVDGVSFPSTSTASP